MYRLEDKKIIFEDGECNFKFLPRIGFGSQSDVYKIQIGGKWYALKVFNELSTVKESDCKSKLDINLDSYVSPIRLLYVKKNFKGYLMNLYKTPDLSERRLKTLPIEEFAKSSVKLYEDTEKLSDLGFTVYNTFISNLIYDDGFKMLATDNYLLNESGSKEQIRTLNNMRVNKLLYDVFVNAIGLAKKFHENVEMTKLKAECEAGRITFEEFMNIVGLIAYNDDKQIITLSDLGKEIREKTKIKR